MRWAGHVACMEQRRGVHRVLVGKPEGKRPLGIPRRRWEDNIKIDLQEMIWRGMDWIDLAQVGDNWRPVVNAVMNNAVAELLLAFQEGLCSLLFVSLLSACNSLT